MSRRGFVCAGLCLALFVACDATAPPSGGSSFVSVSDLPGAAPPLPVPACVASFRGAGHEGVCASCACGRCPDVASACADDTRCLDAAACEHGNGCQGRDCYCGTGVSSWLCGLAPSGPCRHEFEAAAGVRGWTRVKAVLEGGDTRNALVRADRLASCTLAAACGTQCGPEGDECTFEDEACQERYCSVDTAREAARQASAANASAPSIASVYVNGALAWTAGDTTRRPTFRPRDRVALVGTGFGSGVDVDFAKIMIGNSRVLETNLRMFQQKLDILNQVNYETATVESRWDSDVIAWSDTRVEFHVPVHASRGPLRMQVQKRIGNNPSLLQHGDPHSVVDALTSRITDPAFEHTCDVVSELGPVTASEAIPVDVINPDFDALAAQGRRVFWSYDYNIGLTHKIRGLDWTRILAGQETDPVVGGSADPALLFGALRTVRGEVPDEAMDAVTFNPYPMRNPVPGFLLTPQRTSGRTRDSGWVGYRYAQSIHPFNGPGEWIGFNCASCHGYRISYERAPGQQVTRVFPGLPNPSWSMKWTVLGDFEGVRGNEEGPLWAPGTAEVDKTSLLYAMPHGAGEHNVVRLVGEGSHTDNDYQFSPITIPNVTNHMPIRRALSHTESYAGFEGSYIHSEEPDGALGSMRAEDLRALTAYMTQLDASDDDLRNVGLHRWLSASGQLGLAGHASEGELVQRGWRSFAPLAARIETGRATFEARCGSCHSDALGANTNERMIRLDQVGRFFQPTIYHRHTQSIRVAYLRNLYWVQHRGLLSDGHVRNLTDLVDPARCTEGSELYQRYYTLHPPAADLGSPGPDFPALAPGASPRGDVFRVQRLPSSHPSAAARNRFVERHRFFVTVPWDPDHYYWDYQRMRAEYGPNELGAAAPIGMPAAPHPWCAGSASEVSDLVLYLLTL